MKVELMTMMLCSILLLQKGTMPVFYVENEENKIVSTAEISDTLFLATTDTVTNKASYEEVEMLEELEVEHIETVQEEIEPEILIEAQHQDNIPVRTLIQVGEAIREERGVLNLDITTSTFLINKEYPISKEYVPTLVEPAVNHRSPSGSHKRCMRPEAAKALEEMFAAAKKEGHELWVKTAYRSYKDQYNTYTWTLKNVGEEETIYYHAIPGTSEHQTGLAVDIVCEASEYKNEPGFESTKEYIWLKENCYKYGFTLRYLEGKEAITGYLYEPWHYRYVGVELATYLMKHSLTLEEYYNALPKTDLFVIPEQYQSFLNVSNKSPIGDTPSMKE